MVVLKEERRKVEELRSTKSRSHQPRETEPIEVEVISPPRPEPVRDSTPPPPTAIRAMEEERRRFPALRPSIQGQRAVIPDRERDLLPPEIIGDPSEGRISSKKKGGLKGPSFEDMEVFFSVPTEPDRQRHHS